MRLMPLLNVVAACEPVEPGFFGELGMGEQFARCELLVPCPVEDAQLPCGLPLRRWLFASRSGC